MTIKKRIVRIPMLPSQRRFLESAAPVKGFSGPVGSGKTYALCCQALRSAAQNPGCTGLLGAPTYDMLEAVTIPILMDLLDRHKVGHTYRKSQNVVTIKPSRSRILLRSLDCPEHLRGTTLAWIGIDELTYSRKQHGSASKRGCVTPTPKATGCSRSGLQTVSIGFTNGSSPRANSRTIRLSSPRPVKTSPCFPEDLNITRS